MMFLFQNMNPRKNHAIRQRAEAPLFPLTWAHRARLIAGHWGSDTAFKISGLAILVVMTLKHTSRPGPISLHGVMGGVAAYLLIGLTWAFGYKLLMEARPEAIHFRTFVGEIPTGEPSRLIYFRFCTLTSVGYGDAYPVHRIARSLATARHWSGNCIPPF
jgi:hypothetical protein